MNKEEDYYKVSIMGQESMFNRCWSFDN